MSLKMQFTQFVNYEMEIAICNRILTKTKPFQCYVKTKIKLIIIEKKEVFVSRKIKKN